MLKAQEVISDSFVEESWGFYNWLNAGYIHLNYSEFENLDNKLHEGFNALSSEMQKVDEEKKEMKALGRPN